MSKVKIKMTKVKFLEKIKLYLDVSKWLEWWYPIITLIYLINIFLLFLLFFIIFIIFQKN